MAIHYFDDPEPITETEHKPHWYEIGTRIVFTQFTESITQLTVVAT